MDTRFWGPSGWKLLHLITFDYSYSAEKAIYFAAFFETIPYILPCKFCRSSLTDYYKQHPYTSNQLSNGHMDPLLDAKKWLYQIHNCVSGKLRKQGLHKEANPSYAAVKQYYTNLRESSWQAQLALFWDFLFAVAYHHPTTVPAEPMPECPVDVKKKAACEKNKWNVLSPKERMKWFVRFWTYLPDVLPSEIGKHWHNVTLKPDLRSRKSTLAWLWKMRCALDTEFKDPYTSICKKIAGHSSDCGHSNRAITCRRIRSTRKKH